jgi:hypothetical protein
MGVKTMKKALRHRSRAARRAMRGEYRFDYRRARPNRFAAALRDRTAVVLDPDVASVFASPETVNQLLRSVIAALPHKMKTRRVSNREDR